MPEPIGLCLIGAGAIAQRHMEAFERLGGISARWTISRREDAARTFAEKWKFPHAGTSAEEALADPDVQLVLISSPNALHAEQAIQAMQAGKDVIVEIPVAMTWQKAENVAQVATALQRRVWVCQTMRSYPALREVRERVRSGRLHVTQITGFFGIPRRRNQGMGNVGTRSWIDNLLWHHGCHQVDASLWVLDMPRVTRVQALFGPKHSELGMPLDVGVQMTTADGVLVAQSLTYNTEQSEWRLKFIAHEDVLSFDGGRLTNEAGEVLVAGSSLTDLIVQDGELLHAYRSGQPCEFDLSGVLPSMEVLGRAQASAQEAGR